MVQRIHIAIRGAVQGVGFRPFVYRLAAELGLHGWVQNGSTGVTIEAEGEKPRLEQLVIRLSREKPPRSYIQSMEFSYLDPVGYERFDIRQSDSTGEKSVLVLPDIATCPDCLREIFDPSDRRYLYPFTNCTNCGPRFSIIEALPYDRANTSMRGFAMCTQCTREYENPLDRRFHAQPNACPECGPHLELWKADGTVVATNHAALVWGAAEIRAGKAVAVKGLGGFHLVVDARNEAAVQALRVHKHRDEKPFALMFPSIQQVKQICEVSDLEERLLLSPESPIVLLQRWQKDSAPGPTSADVSIPAIASSVAPGIPNLGVMLPYTPLHHILLKELGFPVVATSGNLSDEPICIDEREAVTRLHGIADFFLVHNRPIVRHVDDSVVRVMLGRELVLRRARGYAPLPMNVKRHEQPCVLAVGAHLKNAVALGIGENVFVSQHIGDLETKEAFGAFEKVIADFKQLYGVSPAVVAHDLHPDYLSSHYAVRSGLELRQVQHHYAHVAACMAENELDGFVLGVSWDGTGYGTDGTVWGGEFLLTKPGDFERVASIRTFPLPGGDAAAREPRRTALGLLYELFGDEVFRMEHLLPVRQFTSAELQTIQKMLERNLNTPKTSSIGRLFDAVASLIGVRHLNNFEAQTAMELEFAAVGVHTVHRYSFDVIECDRMKSNDRDGGPPHARPLWIIDWSPMIREIVEDCRDGVPVPLISAKFHNTLAEFVMEVARHTRQGRVVLTGGCFQNRRLTERTVERLREEGFHPYWHQRVPPNDGGIALGQVYAVRLAQGGNGTRIHTEESPSHPIHHAVLKEGMPS